MSDDYGIKLNIAAIFHPQSNGDSLVDVGLTFEDTEGVEVSCECNNRDLEMAVKNIAVQFISKYLTAAEELQEEEVEEEEEEFEDDDDDVLASLLQAISSQKNQPKTSSKKPQFKSRFESKGHSSTKLSNKLDGFLKSLE